MPEHMFDGFDHTQHEEEVEERWGAKAYADGDVWWRGLGDAEKRAFLAEQSAIQDAFSTAQSAGLPVDSEEAQAIAHRQLLWLRDSWQGARLTAEAFTSLGEMYVADPRFGKSYTRVHPDGAEYVRDAMKAYAARHLG